MIKYQQMNEAHTPINVSGSRLSKKKKVFIKQRSTIQTTMLFKRMFITLIINNKVTIPSFVQLLEKLWQLEGKLSL